MRELHHLDKFVKDAEDAEKNEEYDRKKSLADHQSKTLLSQCLTPEQIQNIKDKINNAN